MIMMTVEELNKLLWETDPCSTWCNHMECMEDVYFDVAEVILEIIENGDSQFTIKEMIDIFMFYMDIDSLWDIDMKGLNEVWEELNDKYFI